MSAVWYVGTADSRTITNTQWAALGITAVTKTWDASNGFSVPSADLSAGQIAFLATQSDFLTDQADGARSGTITPVGAEAWDADIAAHAARADLHSSGQRGAYSKNDTGVVQNLSGVSIDVVGLLIEVGLSTRPQKILTKMWVDVVTATAAGTPLIANCTILDSQAVPVAVSFGQIQFEGGEGTLVGGWLTAECWIEPNTPTRMYKVQVAFTGAGGAARLYHAGISPVWRSELWSEFH